jgi:hypothetical protein
MISQIAHDLSEATLAKAQERNVYGVLHQIFPCDRLSFADDAFGAVVAAGVFTACHAPKSSFDELLGVTL